MQTLTSEIKPALTLEQFIESCIAYNKAQGCDMAQLEVCPIHFYASTLSAPCHKTVSGIKTCSVCQKPMCPVCGRHNVQQLSRVTGYISNVSGWNAAKKQELKDRRRTKL